MTEAQKSWAIGRMVMLAAIAFLIYTGRPVSIALAVVLVVVLAFTFARTRDVVRRFRLRRRGWGPVDARAAVALRRAMRDPYVCETSGMTFVDRKDRMVVPTMSRPVQCPTGVRAELVLPPGVVPDKIDPDRLSSLLSIPVRITVSGPRSVLLTVDLWDPFDQVEPASPAAGKPAAAVVHDPDAITSMPITIGIDAEGDRVSFDLARSAHLLAQGSTRSGKSVWAMRVLDQAMTYGPAVRLVGLDPSGLLLEPAAGEPLLAASGPAGALTPQRVTEVLDGLVDELEARRSWLPRHADKLTGFTPTRPLLLVVLEELSSMLAMVDGADRKLGQAARAAIGRLMAEGAKYGIRVVMLSQRFDADMLGGTTRSNATTRVCLRTDTATAVRMVIESADEDQSRAVVTFPPGRFLWADAGHPVTVVQLSLIHI